ncbi:MAG: hypothetical protein LBG27_00095 [Spirochaetaceae bacterium]|jgi:hypothetical protein|nr:hypothetical protein [Spirochaetaceae bacterium]
MFGGERYWSEILWGGPHEGTEVVDWAAVETLAETPIEGILTYKLSWGSPRTNGQAKGNRLSFEVIPQTRTSARLTAPDHG